MPQRTLESFASMATRFYNTLTGSVEDFRPIEDGVIRMYNCGPTVYDYVHIGNFISFLLSDLLRRYFEFTGHEVVQVMNITDVGHMTEDDLADGGGQDKMELAADRLKTAKKQGAADVDDPTDPYQIAAYFTRAFLEDARLIRLKVADEYETHMPHATACIDRMIEMIAKLIDNGHAYVTDDGAVYFDVTSFPDYGKLSGNTLDAVQSGAGGRVEDAHQAGKRHPADFLLWKADDKHLMKWDSPWGTGYPGWHIECSAMALSLHSALAGKPIESIDIHTGGEDNIFPHHECEIAQSRGATGRDSFANFWLHQRHLMVEGEKMSKSKGNFYTLRDLAARGVEPAVLRYELLRTHYRANTNFTVKGLEDSAKAVTRLRDFAATHDTPEPDSPRMGDTEIECAFAEALGDDLNISAALGALFSWIKATPDPTRQDVMALKRIDSVLDVLAPSRVDAPVDTVGLSDDRIDAMAQAMNAARADKDYAASDAIRDELLEAGIEVRIGKDGVTWARKIKLD